MNIKVNKIKPQTVEFFAPDGTSLGFLNEYEMLDLRCQIKEANVEGYYCLFEHYMITVHPSGDMDCWPNGFFDTLDNLMNKFLGWD